MPGVRSKVELNIAVCTVRLMKRRAAYYLVLLLAGVLSGCRPDEQHTTVKTVTVKQEPVAKHLYFSGTIKPIKVVSVSSPVEGIIQEKHFQYGQQLQPNQHLLTLTSNKLAENYQSTLVNYLKAKNAYLSAKEKFVGTQELMRHQLIARDLFDAEQRQLATSHLDYLQARYKLQELSPDEPLADDKLSLDNLQAAAQAIRQPARSLAINAPATGTALMAPKSSNSGQDETEGDKLAIGSAVKSGQTLLTIGDLSGITVDIQIPEIDIDKVQVGLPVTITGAAFPGITLKGEITAVAAQAKPATGGSGGLPTFSAQVTVPRLTAEQRQKVYVGMTAKVDIQLPDKPSITLPINAVYQKDNKAYVKVRRKDRIEERLVQTGKTTPSHVIIDSGLHPGEQVLLND